MINHPYLWPCKDYKKINYRICILPIPGHFFLAFDASSAQFLLLEDPSWMRRLPKQEVDSGSEVVVQDRGKYYNIICNAIVWLNYNISSLLK